MTEVRANLTLFFRTFEKNVSSCCLMTVLLSSRTTTQTLPDMIVFEEVNRRKLQRSRRNGCEWELKHVLEKGASVDTCGDHQEKAANRDQNARNCWKPLVEMPSGEKLHPRQVVDPLPQILRFLLSFGLGLMLAWTTSKKKKRNLLENCHKYALKLF